MEARLSAPRGIALDNQGNLYIADARNSRIRRVAPDGTIATIAGTGTLGFSGDGGPAAEAALGYPTGLALDVAGNLYVIDGLRVRRISADGLIETIAGSGSRGRGGDGGNALAAEFDIPSSIAVDEKGRVYVSEQIGTKDVPGLARVRRFTIGGLIETIAGTETPLGGPFPGTCSICGDGGPATAAMLTYPAGLALDHSGNLFIADGGNSRVRKVTPDGMIQTVAGSGRQGFAGDGGSATQASLSSPWAVSIDIDGNLYIADYFNGRIRRVDRDGLITTFAGSRGRVTSPMGVLAEPGGSVLFIEGGVDRIGRLTADGVVSFVAGKPSRGYGGDGGPATEALLSFPRDIAVDPSGNLFIADSGNQRVRRVDIGGVITTVAGNGLTGLGAPGGRPAVETPLYNPTAITVDGHGDLYFAEGSPPNISVRRVGPDGILGTVCCAPLVKVDPPWLDSPEAMVADAAGNLYIADTGNFRVIKINRKGAVSVFAGLPTRWYNQPPEDLSDDGKPANEVPVRLPTSLAIDTQGNLYIGSRYRSGIRKVPPDGIISTVPGTADLENGPVGLAVDSDGSLYFAAGNAPWKISSTGEIAAIPVQNFPFGHLALDHQGNIYTTDGFSKVWSIPILACQAQTSP
jgi:sugar lactone lactonase YvrE